MSIETEHIDGMEIRQAEVREVQVCEHSKESSGRSVSSKSYIENRSNQGQPVANRNAMCKYPAGERGRADHCVDQARSTLAGHGVK